jgi:ATP-binding cassette, subfamily B, bacterial
VTQGEQAPDDRAILRRGLALLWASALEQWRPFAISVTGATAYAVVTVGGTIVLGRVTDRVLAPAFAVHGEGDVARGTVLVGAAAIVVASLLRMVGVVLRRYFGQMAQRRMQVHWFTQVTDHYLAMPLRWFDPRPAGELLAHADADAERATMAMQPLPFSIGVVVIIVVAMGQLALVDPMLLLVGVALFPSLAVLNHHYTRRVEAPAAAAQARVGEVSAVAHESFEAALLVKTLGLRERELARLHDAADRLRHQRLAVGRLRAAFEPGLDALPNLGTVVLLGVGAWRVSVGAVTIGDLVQAMALFGLLAFPFRVVGFLLEELPRAVVAHDRITTVLRTAPELEAGAVTALAEGPLEVGFHHVGFAYGSEPVLRDLDATVSPGEVVALVGSTGAGKSTLCQLVADLRRPTQGTVTLGGIATSELAADVARGAVVPVFQEAFLFADSVRENLSLGSDVDEAGIWRALDLARARTFVERLPHGLDEVVGERGVTLSGGQRQRLALARALLRSPQVLLLDDATSAVDAGVERAILDGLRTELAATTLIVAHRLSTIALADRVLYLEGGTVAGAGPHRELLALPGYRALVQAYEQDAA